MELSERITFLRESKGLKQYEIANALGIEPPNYSRLEKRGDKLSIEQIKAIATALGVSLNELLGLDAPVENEEKVKELKKRIEELESRIEDKDLVLQQLVTNDNDLLFGIVADVLYLFKGDNEKNPLFEEIEEYPYFKIKLDYENKKRLNLFLYVQGHKSHALMHAIDRFSIGEIIDHLADEHTILRHSDYIDASLKEKLINHYNFKP
jgi:transcriptional regulator with XRE-family HTH domain